MKKKLVEVLWKDPTIEAGWVEDDHNKPLPILHSYGVLIHKGDMVVIAGTISPSEKEKRYADRTKFPKGCVIEIKELGTIEVK